MKFLAQKHIEWNEEDHKTCQNWTGQNFLVPSKIENHACQIRVNRFQNVNLRL